MLKIQNSYARMTGYSLTRPGPTFANACGFVISPGALNSPAPRRPDAAGAQQKEPRMAGRRIIYVLKGSRLIPTRVDRSIYQLLRQETMPEKRLAGPNCANIVRSGARPHRREFHNRRKCALPYPGAKVTNSGETGHKRFRALLRARPRVVGALQAPKPQNC